MRANLGIWLCFALALAACSDSESKAGPIDTGAPIAGAAISFSDLAATSATVSWGVADDDWSSAKSLRYKLVRADEAAQIDTLEEADSITGGAGLVQDYTRGLTSKAVSDLTPGKSYAFAVVVRDNTGNGAFYAPATVTTLDASAPTPGADLTFVDIAATKLTVSWGAASDDVTPTDRLQYKVVLAAKTSEIDTLEEAAALTKAPGLVQDFTAGATSLAVTGLSSSTAYAFAVVVRDDQGNEALYSPATVSTPDVTPPAVGAAITFSNIAALSVTLNWGFATDAISGPFSLKYKVVKASSAAAIDTVDEVDAIVSGSGLVADYASSMLTVNVTGLTSSTSYAFAVVVKDVAGNRALYMPQTVMTLDASAPIVGTALAVSNVTTTGLSLSWGAATDDVTAQGALQYKVVKGATTAAIDTLEEVALITSGGDLLQDFSAALLSTAVTGLASSNAYAFAVVVKDQQGNQAIYTPARFSTLDDTAPVPGVPLSFASVSATGLTVNWGRATDNVSSQAELQYKLVMSASATDIDTIAEVDAIGAGMSLVLDYATDVTTRNVTGLASSTAYAFAVVVRDVAGNKSLYTAQTVSTLDGSAPTVGAALSFSNVTTSQITLSWGAASDDITPVGSLTYKVVLGANAAAIDTLAEIDAITAAPALITDYTANLTTATATGLTSSTSYAFAVVVRDAAGNNALYSPAVRSTVDVTAPVPGVAVSFSAVSGTTLSVDWGAATDDVSSAADLQYKVVQGLQTSDIDTLGEVAAITGPDLIQDFTANVTTVAVTGLTSSTQYAYAVVVRDTAGNEALYTPDIVHTDDITAPTLGAAISFSNLTSTGVTVDWGAATDDVNAAPTLEYKLVTDAVAANIDTLAEADAITGAGLVQDYTPNLTSQAVTGLTTLTSYSFAVIVRDGSGNQALYAPATTTTP